MAFTLWFYSFNSCLCWLTIVLAFFPFQTHSHLSVSPLTLLSFWIVLSCHVFKLNVCCYPDLSDVFLEPMITQYEMAMLSFWITLSYFNSLHGIYHFWGCFVRIMALLVEYKLLGDKSSLLRQLFLFYSFIYFVVNWLFWVLLIHQPLLAFYTWFW